MIDLVTIQRYDLRLTLYFDRFDRQWHAVVSADGRPSLDVADQDGDVALATAVAQFVERMRPKPAD